MFALTQVGLEGHLVALGGSLCLLTLDIDQTLDVLFLVQVLVGGDFDALSLGMFATGADDGEDVGIGQIDRSQDLASNVECIVLHGSEFQFSVRLGSDACFQLVGETVGSMCPLAVALLGEL